MGLDSPANFSLFKSITTNFKILFTKSGKISHDLFSHSLQISHFFDKNHITNTKFITYKS